MVDGGVVGDVVEESEGEGGATEEEEAVAATRAGLKSQRQSMLVSRCVRAHTHTLLSLWPSLARFLSLSLSLYNPGFCNPRSLHTEFPQLVILNSLNRAATTRSGKRPILVTLLHRISSSPQRRVTLQSLAHQALPGGLQEAGVLRMVEGGRGDEVVSMGVWVVGRVGWV